jgi:hypothetical protein
VFAATGMVLGHAQPSTSSSQIITSSAVVFGSHPTGEFTDQPIEVHNFNYAVEPYQALLQAYAYSVSGADSAYFSIPGFAPLLAATPPATYPVRFHDTAVTVPRTYVATLRVYTRDQPDLLGTTNLATLQWTLIATVTEINSSTDETPVARTWLYRNVPNPFNPTTTIAFDLRRDGAARLEVFSTRGRLVRTLFDGRLGAGAHGLVWDGRDDGGRLQASGVYFYRLRADGIEQTQRMTLVR